MSLTPTLRLWSLVLLLGGIVCLAGCEEEDTFKRRNNPLPPEPAKTNPDGNPVCSERTGKVYKGLSGEDLTANRVNAALNVDRLRIKPHGVLAGEYTRAVGAAPASLAGNAATFGAAPARWYTEPKSSAVAVSTYFTMGFEACLQMTQSPAEYAAAPDDKSAASQCGSMARKFWSRSATEEEIKACVQVATVDSAAETAPRRRWAYACASLLTASGFVSY